MKYAILGFRNHLVSIHAAAVDRPHAVITDAQAAQIVALRAAKTIPIWFAGEVTSRQAERDAGRPLRWDEEVQDYTRVVVVPAEIENWRARAVLEIAGLLAAVETALAAIEGDAGIVARAAWTSGATLARKGPTVTALALELSLTPEQVDAMFAQAATLVV